MCSRRVIYYLLNSEKDNLTQSVSLKWCHVVISSWVVTTYNMTWFQSVGATVWRQCVESMGNIDLGSVGGDDNDDPFSSPRIKWGIINLPFNSLDTWNIYWATMIQCLAGRHTWGMPPTGYDKVTSRLYCNLPLVWIIWLEANSSIIGSQFWYGNDLS